MKTTTLQLSKIKLLIAIFFAVLVLILLVFGTEFFAGRNLSSIAFQMGEFGFISMAMALAMLTGGIDLSVVANMNLAGIFAAFILTNEPLIAAIGTGNVVVLAVAVALLTGTAGGILNGLIISKVGVHSVLTTIGTMMLFGGIGMIVTQGEGVVGFPFAFSEIGNGDTLGIPNPFVLMVVAFLVLGFMLKRSRWGRRLYLFGANPIASLFSGIKNDRTTIQTFAVAGLLAGFSAILLISRSNSARVGYGETYLLQAILVAVMGTMDPYGGHGRLSGIFLSVVLLQTLSAAFTRLGITPFARGLVIGTVLLVAMVAYQTIAERTITVPRFLMPWRNRAEQDASP
jgi:simple sugar transport system permease protein